MDNADLTHSSIFNKITQCSFVMYSDEQISSISVKQIKLPLTFDSMGEPVIDGLYDPKLGPYHPFEKCETCNQTINFCPGHIGNIPLDFPVFSPVFSKSLHSILKLLCLFCGNFKEKIVSKTLKKLKKQKETMPLEEFYSRKTLKACQKCNCITPSFIKEGINKLLITQLRHSETTQNAKNLEGRPCPPLLEINKKREILPHEIKPILSEFWRLNYKILPPIVPGKKRSAKDDYNIFFVNNVLVSPSRFRPVNVIHGITIDNPKTDVYVKLIETNSEMKKMVELRKNNKIFDENDSSVDNYEEGFDYALRSAWSKLQSDYASLYDSKYALNEIKFGLKQLLEKKQGIIRSNFMGKRVNFSARSILSPDMWIETTEIGVPKRFAMDLTFPEHVTELNSEKMKSAVINGANKHPGANFVEDENGRIIDLAFCNETQRRNIANSLQISNFERKCVYRHMIDGDYVLMNRQPTLHKASMMGHRVKILKTSHEVIRMHYTNCNTYNADFDGDEINLHLPQNYAAQTELRLIAATQNQYISPKNTSPLRGLVQDHVCGALLLSKRDTFFDKEEYHQYLCITLSRDELAVPKKTKTLPPAILKPKKLWTGKQILSTILRHISDGRHPLNLVSKAQVSSECFKENLDDPFISKIIVSNGEWLTGVCDKAQIGSSKFGVISAVHELYGPEAADSLLTKFGKLFTTFLQDKGLTASASDLILKKDTERFRRKNKKMAEKVAKEKGREFLKSSGKSGKEKLLTETGENELDARMKDALNPLASDVSENAFPYGMMKKFPQNNFALMVLSGGKGSSVNISQICTLLGQQELEGRRVPRTIAGKTLPSFKAFDLGAQAGGFITDRFLTGINPKVYFFHCMAGREGLVDTAVKTSRSGYLQRCIVKGLENVAMKYDNTVRDSNGDLIQFHYGGDGIDPVKSAYLHSFDFIRKNLKSYERISDMVLKSGVDKKAALKYFKRQKQSMEEKGDTLDPVMSKMDPFKNMGCVSEDFYNRVSDYTFRQFGEMNDRGKKSRGFREAVFAKFIVSCVEPGESVGIIAGQSIGEPSTQMTLNTFHLAGHGGANVTLGIPRLAEILMTGSKTIKTPTMDFGLLGNAFDPEKGKQIAEKLSALCFSSIISKVKSVEKIGSKNRKFLLSIELIKGDLKVSWNRLERKIKTYFVAMLLGEIDQLINAEDDIENNNDFMQNKVKPAQKENNADDEEDITESEENSESAAISSDSDGGGFYVDEKGEDLDKIESDKNTDTENEINLNGDKSEQNESENSDEFVKKSKIRDLIGDKYFESVNLDKSRRKISIRFHLPADVKRRIFLIQTTHSLAARTKLRHAPRITKCYVLQSRMAGGGLCTRVQTDGANFDALRRLAAADAAVDPHSARSNDVAAVLGALGVEAARAVAAEQVRAVFAVYGIRVDERHLSLISEAMAWRGGFAAFNRHARSGGGPLLRMSFESGLSALERALRLGESDAVASHSARLVVGRPVGSGTGAFELLARVHAGGAAAD